MEIIKYDILTHTHTHTHSHPIRSAKILRARSRRTSHFCLMILAQYALTLPLQFLTALPADLSRSLNIYIFTLFFVDPSIYYIFHWFYRRVAIVLHLFEYDVIVICFCYLTKCFVFFHPIRLFCPSLARSLFFFTSHLFIRDIHTNKFFLERACCERKD